MNHIINSALNWFTGHPLYIALLAVVLLALAFGGANSCASRKYDKERQAYEAQSKQWAAERLRLEGQIADRDKQIELLEAKEAAIIAADQAGKKLDDAIADKIDAATKAAADEAVAVNEPTNCWIRADRTCSKLAGLRPPINIDCNIYKRKLCSGN